MSPLTFALDLSLCHVWKIKYNAEHYDYAKTNVDGRFFSFISTFII